MPGMPGVLLDHVDKDSAQAERLVPARDDDQLINPCSANTRAAAASERWTAADHRACSD